MAEINRLISDLETEALMHEADVTDALRPLQQALRAVEGVRNMAQSATSRTGVEMAVASCTSVLTSCQAIATTTKSEANYQLGATTTEIFQAKMQAYDAQWAALEQRAAANNAAIDQLAGKYGIDLSSFRNERAALEDKLNQTQDRVERALIRTDMAQNDVDAAEATVEELRKRGASPRDIEEAERRLSEARRILAETQTAAKKEVELKQQQLQAEQKQIEEAKKKIDEEGKAEIAAAQLKIIDAERNREKVRNDPNSTPEEKAEADKKVEEAKKESAKKEEGLVQKQEQFERQEQENIAYQKKNGLTANRLQFITADKKKAVEDSNTIENVELLTRTSVYHTHNINISTLENAKHTTSAFDMSAIASDLTTPVSSGSKESSITGGEEAKAEENKSPNIPQKLALADTNLGRA